MISMAGWSVKSLGETLMEKGVIKRLTVIQA
jgi:hypothetical protein